MPNKTFIAIAVAFLAPVLVAVAMHWEGIVDDLTPRPENGYLVYVTMDR